MTIWREISRRSHRLMRIKMVQLAVASRRTRIRTIRARWRRVSQEEVCRRIGRSTIEDLTRRVAQLIRFMRVTNRRMDLRRLVISEDVRGTLTMS